MCSYFTLNANAENYWETLRNLLEGDENYFTGIMGNDEEGYQFWYFSSTTRYESGVYPSREGATEGLRLALLRSLILNSPLSAFVSSNTDIILVQSEQNISEFGWQKGNPKSMVDEEEALWCCQRAFDYKVYVHKGSVQIQKEAG